MDRVGEARGMVALVSIMGGPALLKLEPSLREEVEEVMREEGVGRGKLVRGAKAAIGGRQRKNSKRAMRGGKKATKEKNGV